MFWSSFVNGLFQLMMVDPLGLIFQKYLNSCKLKFWQPLMNNTSELFSLMCKRFFLYYLVLKWTEFDLSKINWLRGIIRLHYNSIGVLGQVSIVSHSYQTFFSFLRSDLNLGCRLHDPMITRFASPFLYKIT
jgi:hypothetical protein